VVGQLRFDPTSQFQSSSQSTQPTQQVNTSTTNSFNFSDKLQQKVAGKVANYAVNKAGTYLYKNIVPDAIKKTITSTFSFNAGAEVGTQVAAETAKNAAASSFSAADAASTAGTMLVTAGIGYLGQKHLGGKAGMGAAAGAALGAKYGSVVPGLGTITGAVIGAVIGSLFGQKRQNNEWQLSAVHYDTHEAKYDHGFGYDIETGAKGKRYSQANADTAVQVGEYIGKVTKNLEALSGVHHTGKLFIKVGSRSGYRLIDNDTELFRVKGGYHKEFVYQAIDKMVDKYEAQPFVDKLAVEYGITRDGAGEMYNAQVMGLHQLKMDEIENEKQRVEAAKQRAIAAEKRETLRQAEIAGGTRRGMPSRPGFSSGSNSFTPTARPSFLKPRGILAQSNNSGSST